MSSKLGLPHSSSADLLLQAAMERTEAVTPEEFKVAYADAVSRKFIGWVGVTP